MTDLDGLVETAWHAHASGGDVVVRPSIPILWFGDARAYSDSPLRVVTLGLNPSRFEFPSAEPMMRFPAARHLANSGSLDGSHPAYIRALDEYFRREPYRKWFDRGFEPLLNGLGASYYSNKPNTALHTDLLSPLATNPTWSKLGRPRQALLSDGVPLWHALMEYLRPDVIVASIARPYLAKIGFERTGDLREIHRVERKNPFVTEATELRIGHKTTTLVFGRCVNLPFGSVSFPDRETIGKAIGALPHG